MSLIQLERQVAIQTIRNDAGVCLYLHFGTCIELKDARTLAYKTKALGSDTDNIDIASLKIHRHVFRHNNRQYLYCY